ncbi:RHS repeat-associated core domain-containing protein [Dissulfurirhabdus thermomarina]|nr:RHS repeat-associated core domain-containing protein [Dissulfurirhabdus thermomarina]
MTKISGSFVWHRYYDPQTGRYLTPDPLGLAGGINRYAYVQNDPVNVIDPLGLWTFTYSADGHAPTGPWPVAAGGTASSKLVNPLDASGKLESRGVTPEATAGVWADIGVSAGVGDLSGTGNQAGPTVGIGAGRYGGIQFTLRREFDESRSWYDPLRYLDGVSVGLGIGLGLPVNVTVPLESNCLK